MTHTEKTVQQIDYSQKDNWVAFENNGNKPCDVFFVHPTTYLDESDGMNARLDNVALNAFTAQLVQELVGTFAESCNIYAPKYRQASINVLTLPAEEGKQYLDFGRKDVENAWQYYRDNINQNKPYFIASHSQGSNNIKDMLVEQPNSIPKENLVGIYAIGYTVTEQDIEKIGVPLGITPTQTPALITWNTIGKGGQSIVIKEGALAVNPLDWTNSKQNQPNSKNTYAYINGRKIPHFTSAQIDDNGALVIPTPEIIDELLMPMGEEVYHIYDYNFFYGNIVQNVAERLKAWQEKTQRGL
ncbi:DUF3089 domain-containing protein [Neisseria montereyensis]|uniref:DUF3089 domain-containing protein n=1 Tax=Neisseria montereyensis TaxID=2973938 RepID=A0ABT2FC72_9NEIS|nr:DUF3089 domain-containing protein [Neisseria montereyensis]MCS4533738.1 DUF3089 domain-containing protein [Neisseria montereyensis]